MANNRLYLVAPDGRTVRIASSMGGGWSVDPGIEDRLAAFFTIDTDQEAALGNCFGKTALRIVDENGD